MSPGRTAMLGLLGPMGLRVEAPVQRTPAPSPSIMKGKGWSYPRGAYTPREIVQLNAPLLETVVHHLGPSPAGQPPARDILLHTMSLSLSVGDKVSALTIPTNGPTSAELIGQAESIGKSLLQYAKETTNSPYDPEYQIRSPCEGHLWTDSAAQLLFGPRSAEHLPQLFNEYLHQTILLRDSLLPFKNYEDVVIPVETTEEDRSTRGLRWMQSSRSAFLMAIMSTSISQDAIFKFAKASLAPTLTAESSYGFQYEHGLILPSFIAGDNSLRLLQFIPAVIDTTTPRVAFKYEPEDYYCAPRTEIQPPDESILLGDEVPETCSHKIDEYGEIAYVPLTKGLCTASRQLQVSITRSNITASIDLGQISRGRRYSYPVGKAHGAPTDIPLNTSIYIHSGWKLLTECGPGFITAKEGIHLIKTNSRLEVLALLGKIYPESVTVMSDSESIKDALASGKGFSTSGRFVIQAKGEAADIVHIQRHASGE